MMSYQPYNPMFNPYVTPQQMQPSPLLNYQPQRPSGIPGRVVNDVNEVTPNEISMDGRVSLFPTNDYSCIYAKAWNSDGTISTVKFVPEPVPEAPQANANSSLDLTPIMERLDKIDKQLAELL